MTVRLGAIITALLATAFAVVTFLAEPIFVRVSAAILALIGAVACWILWLFTGPRERPPSVGLRIWLWLDMILFSLLAFGAAFVGLAVLSGAYHVNRSQPVGELDVWIGLGILVVAVLALVTWWFVAAFAIIFRWSRVWPRLRASIALALVVVGGLLTWLTLRDVPRENADLEIREQARRAGLGLYDLVLVVDPADHASRQLIEAARRQLAAGGSIFTTEQGAVSYDLAVGLAVAQRPAGRRPLWRLVEPPTRDGLELTDSLARVTPRRGPPAGGSYGRLLADMLEQDRVRWRRGAQRGVAFMLQSLPSLLELDRDLRGRAQGDAIPRWALARQACGEFLSAHGEPDIREEPWAPVAWGDALAAHCRRLEDYRAWQAGGRDPDEVPREDPVAVHAVTGETRGQRDVDWWTWARALDGVFHRPPLVQDNRGKWRAEAEGLLRDTAKLHTGQPVGGLAEIVEWFRPHLFFDSEEELKPVDVDWFLSQPGLQGESHEICDRERGFDNCEPLAGPADLVGQLDEYIDLRGTARFFGENPRRQRMYVHVRRSRDRVFLGYWWFFPSNVSPYRPEINCLPGFTFADATCFDHEADWEGVTVELKLGSRMVVPDPYHLPNLTPKAVIYDRHGVSVRWKWDAVDLMADPKSYATHPVVYVAKGSHASYPAACAKKQCDQRLGGDELGEGRFNGRKRWRYNRRDQCYPGPDADGRPRDPCLLPLPTTRDGRLGTLWNAFQGRWGAATCVRLARACTQTEGPVSPSRQKRFTKPRDTVAVSLEQLELFQRDYRVHRRRKVRWPPTPWPPPEGEPAPATPALPR
jgi:hypothetical protein